MSKFEVSYSDDAVTFVNVKTNKAEKLAMLDIMEDAEAIKAIRSEQNAAVSASRASVSLLCHILDNPRLDGYRGTCPVDESTPSELKAAIRDLETEYLKPIFCAPMAEKGAKPATIEKQWQEYSRGLKEGGSYAVAKGHVTKLFAYTGMLPTRNGKLFTVAAIKKLLENLEKPEQEKSGITGKLMTIASTIDTHSGDSWDILGDVASGIAALKAILATYEACHRENVEAAMVTHEHKNVNSIASNAMSKAMQPATV